ncbi:MAG: MerR family transcriptional regulator [Chitinophagaceae bacterium]|nr:MerR family transcriptional regulator [Chitinophagaceae bacterium]MBL0055620.1 MerR family transcriptional regulator [Chitinophagaceae bacterium]
MNSFTIKDLENLSGIKAHTIRIWEQRYSFLKPERTTTNIRYYTNKELKNLLNIALLNKYGYKISHIDKMNHEEINEKILSLNQMEAQQERIINDLIQYMVDLDTDQFEAVVNSHILNRGIDKTITQILFPFLEKIGILWLTNHINPAQEHLVSNIIRRKLNVGIDEVFSSIRIDKTVLLFLPESEYHELGLLFMYYTLKSRGISVIYLGANIPLDDVEYVALIRKPDYIYSHITSPGNRFKFERFMVELGAKFPHTPVIISGQVTQNYTQKLPPSIRFKKTASEIMEFVLGI